MIKLLFLFTSLAFGQTRVSYNQQGVTLQSAEGDWCPVKVFTRTSDKNLVVTREASQSNPCYLHLSNQIIYQWTQNATVTINGTDAFDDVVFFYLTAPVLHISARMPERYSCQGCVIDPKRVTETFPANSLIVGFYNVAAGNWAISGNAIINQHQIVNSQPLLITYIPNQGYTFTIDAQSPAVQAARQAVQQMMPAANVALTNIQTAGQNAVLEVKKTMQLAGSMPTDVNIAAAQQKLADLKDQTDKLATQHQQLRMNGMNQMMYRPEPPDPRMYMNQMFPDILFRQRIPSLSVEDTRKPCGMGMWSSADDLIWFCLSGKWTKFQLVQ